MENEIWKDIEGYEGYYQVSNLGRVRSLDRMIGWRFGVKQFKKGTLLKPKKTRGYDCVGLSINRHSSYKRIHRLVAIAFIPNPDNLPQINHKDNNPHNNKADNLEWCDAKYNCNYGDHNKKLSEAGKRRFQKPEEYRKLIEMVRRQNNDPIWKAHQRAAQLNNSNSKPVLMLSLDGEIQAEFPSQSEAARQTGILAQNIGQCCLGRQLTAGKHKWRYKDDNNS